MSVTGIPSIWPFVISSAVVGALVSAAITFISQLLERRARRKELLLSRAIDLAFRRTDVGMRMAEKTGRGVFVPDDVVLAAEYYKELQHVIDKGDLSAEFKAEVEESYRKEQERVAAERKASADKRREDDRKVDEWNNLLGR